MQQPILSVEQAKSDKGRELLAICHSISNDGELRQQGFQKLQDWLGQNSKVGIPAVTFIRMLVKKVTADNVITKAEGHQLFTAIKFLIVQHPLANGSSPVHDQTQHPLVNASFPVQAQSQLQAQTQQKQEWQGYRMAYAKLLFCRTGEFGLVILVLLFVVWFLVSLLVDLSSLGLGKYLFPLAFIVALIPAIREAYIEMQSFKRVRLTLYTLKIEFRASGEHGSSTHYIAKTSLGEIEINKSSCGRLQRFSQMPWPDSSRRIIELDQALEFECGVTNTFNPILLWLHGVKEQSKIWEPIVPIISPPNTAGK